MLANNRKNCMGYCTQNGTDAGDIMPARISQDILLDLVSENDVVVQSVIDEAIEAADAIINSYCGVRYSVPFASPMKIVTTLSADIAVYMLFKKRSGSVGMPDSIRTTYEDAIDLLKNVSSGKASLGVDPSPAATSSKKAYIDPGMRTMTKDGLHSF